MTSDSLQDTLYRLTESGSLSNPAYSALLHDYAKYHAVLLIEGGMFAIALAALSLYFWGRLRKAQRLVPQRWSFERGAYLGFGLTSAVAALLMLLIAAANLSNVLNPENGFAQSIPDLGTPRAGTHRAALHRTVNAWARSRTAEVPPILREGMRDRLAWQRPKAIVCSLLLAVFTVLTARLWRRLIGDSRSGKTAWGPRAKALTAMGVMAVPVTLLLMVMALANTQAALAPMTLTLLFS